MREPFSERRRTARILLRASRCQSTMTAARAGTDRGRGGPVRRVSSTICASSDGSPTTRSRATPATSCCSGAIRGRAGARGRVRDASRSRSVRAPADDTGYSPRSVARLVAARPGLFQVPRPRSTPRVEPGQRSARAACVAGAADLPGDRRGRSTARGARRLDASRRPRSRADRSAVCDRAPRVGARPVARRRPQSRRGVPDVHRQGIARSASFRSATRPSPGYGGISPGPGADDPERPARRPGSS